MIVSCDPGLEGAFCLNDWESGRLEVVPMPTQKRQIKGRALRDVIDEGEVLSLLQTFAALGATHLFIEQVGGIPGQSAPAAFSFGQGYGAVRMAAMAAGLALETVPPAVWKAALKVPKDKTAARHRASEMLPAHRHLWPRVKDDGKAEAAMLALYGERWVKGQFTQRTPRDETDIARAAQARQAAAERKVISAQATRARMGMPPRSSNEPCKTDGFPKI